MGHTQTQAEIDAATLTPKIVGEDCFVDFDFTNLVKSGEVISNPVFTIWRKSGAADTDPDAMKVQTPVVDPNNALRYSQKLTAGVAGCDYYVQMQVDGDQGNKPIIILILPVVAIRLG